MSIWSSTVSPFLLGVLIGLVTLTLIFAVLAGIWFLVYLVAH
jgi:hypothetical protein